MWCKHVVAEHAVEVLAIVVDIHADEGDGEAGEVDSLRWGPWPPLSICRQPEQP